MTDTPAQFQAKIARFALTLPTQLRAGTEQTALAVTTILRAEIAAASGGDSRLSGVGKRGVRVGARYDIKGFTNPTALIRATGPLHLLTWDTKPHLIPRQRGSVKRRRRILFAEGYGHPVRGPIEHPGTKGKHPWEHGLTKARPIAPAAYRRAVRTSLAKTFIGG